MTYQNPVTNDLSKFGARERRMAEELLKAWREQGLPDDFDDNEVSINMNVNSGFVFLSNEDYQVAMMNGRKLESFYSCPQCGHEGFKEDMLHDSADYVECRRYLVDIGVLSDGGHCRCGKPLPSVKSNEIPFEFCSAQCKRKAESEETAMRT